MKPNDTSRRALPDESTEWVQWIQAYNLPSLQMLCRARGIPVREGMTKFMLGHLIASELFRPSVLRSLLADLSPEEREWLDLFRRNRGVLRAADLARNRSDMPEAGLRRLAVRGLIVPGPFDGRVPQGTFDVTAPRAPLWCPETVTLLAADERPEPELPPYTGAVVKERPGDFRALEHDLMVLADQLQQAPVRRLKSGFPGKRFLTRVAGRLRVPVDAAALNRMETSGRILLLYDLLEELGLLRSRHDRITTSPAIEEFFREPPHERVAEVLEGWQQLTRYNEMYHIKELAFGREFPDYEGGEGKADDLPTPERLVGAREFLLALAGRMPPGAWVALDEVINAAYLLDDGFLIRPPQSYFYAHAPLYLGIWLADDSQVVGMWSWGIERAGNWRLVEGRFIREVLAGSLHAVGMIDVAETPDGRTLLRLNDLGAWLIAGGPKPELSLPPGRALVVQPNFDIIVFPEGQDVSLLWPLLQATEVISRDVTLTLRLTADSIYRASQRGISAASVLSLLQAHARSPIPENVRQAMEDWDHRNQQVAITTYVDLIEAESAERFAELLAEVNGKQTIIRPLSETVGVVVGPVSKLPPMTTLDYQAPLPPAVTISPDLDITIEPAKENWRVRLRLAAIAEKTGPNTFRITRKSVARGVANGYYYDEALELLRLSAKDGLPTRAAFKLQGLFGHHGPASVGEVRILQVTRETVLTTMLEIEDFRELLLQRLGPTTALVRTERMETLLAVLEEFGIPNDAASLREVRLPEVRKNTTPQDPYVLSPKTTRLQTYSTRKTREMLEEAIRQNRRVRLRYQLHAGGRTQERTVDPIDVERRHGVAYLTAYCHLRGEVQVFRIPSIVALELLDTPVSPR